MTPKIHWLKKLKHRTGLLPFSYLPTSSEPAVKVQLISLAASQTPDVNTDIHVAHVVPRSHTNYIQQREGRSRTPSNSLSEPICTNDWSGSLLRTITTLRTTSRHLEGIQSFDDYLVAIRNRTPPNDSAIETFWHPYEQQYRVYQLLQSDAAEQERAYGSNEELVNA